jgi:hypothetical protein
MMIVYLLLQEEGWLMGIKENGEKGLFPANFTRPI